MAYLAPRMACSLQDYDVLVVGGGPAGCATALSIAKHDSTSRLRVLVIDDADPAAYKVGESLPAVARRTVALLHPSLATGLAHDTCKGLHEVCTGNASAWTSPKLYETYALMDPYGAGWHLDRARFDETLRETCGGILRKGRFVALRRVNNCVINRGGEYGWEVDAKMTSSGMVETFRARWIVDATGRKASIARKIGATMRKHKHSDLLSFYIVFRNSLDLDPDTSVDTSDTDRRTLIEAAPSGWWYTARLPRGKRLVIYTTSPSDPTARVARTTTGFLDMLHSQTQHIARALHGPGSTPEDSQGGDLVYEPESPAAKFTRSTAAGSAVLEPYADWEPFLEAEGLNVADETAERKGRGRGWCAVGDAALAFDPLSAQGIITALNAGSFLGSALARYFAEIDANPATATSFHSSRGRGQDGESTVREIEKAYEQVRLKYEEGRAYYYDIIRKFDSAEEDIAGSVRDDGNSDGSFWASQRARRS